MKMSPLQVWLKGSNDDVDAGALLDCLSMAKKPNMRN